MHACMLKHPYMFCFPILFSGCLAIIHFEISNAMGADIQPENKGNLYYDIFNYNKRQTIKWVQFTVV